MPRQSLTDLSARNARPGSTDRLLSAGSNLFLRVRPNGAKSWVVRIERAGVRRVHSLGAYPDTTLAKARVEAAKIVGTERGTARVSVADSVEIFMDMRIRPRYRKVGNAEVYCNALKSSFGQLSVDTVRPVDISHMVASYRRKAPVASMRMLAYSKGFFSWCVSMGYIERSPASDIKASSFGVEEKARERVLTDAEIRRFWHADDLRHVPLLRFLLLTGLRISEAQTATVDRIDGEWLTIPPELAKNKREHRAHLSPLARTQIDASASPSLFHEVSPTAVQSALHRWQDRHGIAPRWTPHDLRRTFATRCGDLGVAPHVISKLLGHTFEAAQSTPVYLRSEWWDERKAATAKLAAHIAQVIK